MDGVSYTHDHAPLNPAVPVSFSAEPRLDSPRVHHGLRSSDHASFSVCAGGAPGHAALLQRQQELVEVGGVNGSSSAHMHGVHGLERGGRVSDGGDSTTSSMQGGGSGRRVGARGGLFSGKGSLFQRLARSVQGGKKGRKAALKHAEWREAHAMGAQHGWVVVGSGVVMRRGL